MDLEKIIIDQSLVEQIAKGKATIDEFDGHGYNSQDLVCFTLAGILKTIINMNETLMWIREELIGIKNK